MTFDLKREKRTVFKDDLKEPMKVVVLKKLNQKRIKNKIPD